MISDQEMELAERVVRLHDGKNYKALQAMSMPPKIPDDGKITESMYQDMCADIKREKGELQSITPIECLLRESSKFTLWKAKYSKSDYLVFWAIGFDSETLTVQDVFVQW